MCEGAIGLSAGLFYAPQNFAKTDEVIALAKEAKEREKELNETEKKMQVKLLIITEEAAEGPSPGDRKRKK